MADWACEAGWALGGKEDDIECIYTMLGGTERVSMACWLIEVFA